MRSRMLNFTLELPPGWRDITAELPGSAAPTVASGRGVGAMQLTQAELEDGAPMTLSADELLALVRGIAHGTLSFDERCDTSIPVRVGAISMAMDGRFVRLWGICDGRGVVIATYTCDWKRRRRAELEECERLVASIRVIPPAMVGIA